MRITLLVALLLSAGFDSWAVNDFSLQPDRTIHNGTAAADPAGFVDGNGQLDITGMPRGATIHFSIVMTDIDFALDGFSLSVGYQPHILALRPDDFLLPASAIRPGQWLLDRMLVAEQYPLVLGNAPATNGAATRIDNLFGTFPFAFTFSQPLSARFNNRDPGGEVARVTLALDTDPNGMPRSAVCRSRRTTVASAVYANALGAGVFVNADGLSESLPITDLAVAVVDSSAPLRGDANSDDAVDLNDVVPAVACILGGGACPLTGGAIDAQLDLDCSGSADIADLRILIDLLTGHVGQVGPRERFGDEVAPGANLFDLPELIGRPVITAVDVTVSESASVASIPVAVDQPVPAGLTFVPATIDGEAVVGEDFSALAAAPVALPAGAGGGVVEVSLIDDQAIEANETFRVVLDPDTFTFTGNRFPIALGANTATATIIDDDVARISVLDAAIDEGDSGQRAMPFVFRLSRPAPAVVTVDAATASGAPGLSTAIPGQDYTARVATVVFPTGTTEVILDVQVSGDATIENDEQFSVTLSNPRLDGQSSASIEIADGVAVGTIRNDDFTQITMSIADASATESSGRIRFPITLSSAASDEVTVTANTTAGSAGPSDFVALNNQTVTINAGQTSVMLDVMVNEDMEAEDSEDFQVMLSNPRIDGMLDSDRLVLGDATAVGTITNDDINVTVVATAAGAGGNARLDGPVALATGPNGEVVVAGQESDNVLRISGAGPLTEVINATGDGFRTLDRPSDVLIDPDGNIYVAGNFSENVFKVLPGGFTTEIIDTTAGGLGNLFSPSALARDGVGSVYVAGFDSDNVFRIGPDQRIIRVLDAEGDGAGAMFSGGSGLAVDGANTVFATGSLSANVFAVPSGSSASVIVSASGDGINTLLGPSAVAVDSVGNVYVAGFDSDNVFMISTVGLVTIVLDAFGAGEDAPLDGPRGLAVDDNGNVFVAGSLSDNVLMISSLGVVSEILNASGAGPGAMLDQPVDVAVDDQGHVFVAGFGSDNVLRIDLGGQ